MSYKAGDLTIVTANTIRKEFELDADEDPAEYAGMDSRADYKRWPFPFVRLPHSCDAWVIGGPEEMRAMIVDLQAALALMESL